MTGPRLESPPTIAELLARLRAQRDATAVLPTSVAAAEQQRLDEAHEERLVNLSTRTRALGFGVGLGKAGLGMAEFPAVVAQGAVQDLSTVPDLPAAAQAGMSDEARAAEQRVRATMARPEGSQAIDALNPVPMIERLAKGILERDPEAWGEAAGLVALPAAHGLLNAGKPPLVPKGLIEARLNAVRAARAARLDQAAAKAAAPLIPATFLRRGGQVTEMEGGMVVPTQRPQTPPPPEPTVPQTLETPTYLRKGRSPEDLPTGAPEFLRRLFKVGERRGSVSPLPAPRPGTELAPTGPPEFYSRMQHRLDTSPFAKGTVDQWRAHLGKEVNQAELQDTGLKTFLDQTPAGTVLTRDQVQLAMKPVVTEEVYLGGSPPSGREISDRLREARSAALDFQTAWPASPREALEITDKINDLVRAGHTLREIREMEPSLPGEETAALVSALRNVHTAERNTPPTRHSQYQLPGGTDYREIVMRAPPQPDPVKVKALDEARVAAETSRQQITQTATTTRSDYDNEMVGDAVTRMIRNDLLDSEIETRLHDYGVTLPRELIRSHRAAIKEFDRALDDKTLLPVYRNPSHWPGVDNPIAHLRLNRRTLPDGRTATHVEEFQSDVHEAGREQGYEVPPEEQAQLEQDANDALVAILEARDALDDLGVGPHETDRLLKRMRDGETPDRALGHGEFDELTGEQLDHLRRFGRAVERAGIASEAAERGMKGVPKLPFARTEDWTGLLVRRALAEAVRDGSDVLTWTTGEQQAHRWSQALQRGIDEVHWDRQSGELTFYKNGRRLEVHDIPPTGTVEGLTGVVGRDVAENLYRQKEADREAGFEGGQSVVRGTDLVVGAAGMRTYYDRIVPKVIQDYLKKLGIKDVKPELTEAEAAPQGPKTEWTGDDLARMSREAQAEGELALSDDLQELSGTVSGDEVVTRADIERDILGTRRHDVLRWLAEHDTAVRDRVSLDDLSDAARHLVDRGSITHLAARQIYNDVREMRMDPEMQEYHDAGMHRGNVIDTWGDMSDVGPEVAQVLWDEAQQRAGGRPQPPKRDATWALPITPALKAKIQSGEGLYLYTGLDPRLAKGAGALAGAAAGAVVGAGSDKDHPIRGALLGAGLGALGGGLIRKALDARRGTPIETTARPIPEAAVEAGTARRPGGLPVEPPITPADFVNTAKFDLDPTGKVRLEAEVERVVNEFGMNPKKVVTWTELRETAAKLGVDFTEGNRPTSTRMSAPQMLAVRNIVSANVAELERISGELAKPALTTPEREALEGRLRAIEGQNAHLLDRFIRSRSEAGRDLNSLKVIANRTLDPTYWYTKARNFKGADLTADEQVNIRRLGEARDRAGLVSYVSKLKKAGPGEQLLTLWKAGLLTNPKTHVVNLTGNTTFAMMETAKDPVAAMVDRLLQIRTGERTKGGLTRLTMEASVRGARKGIQEAKDILRGRPNPAQVAKLELRPDVSFNNVILDTYVKTVFRLLEAGDRPFFQSALFRSLAEQAEVAGKKMGLRGVKLREYVEGIQKGEGPLADELVTQAISDANVATFKDNTTLGRAAQSFARTVPGGQVILPFQRTPGAVATRVIEYSPLGLARGLKNAIEVGLKGKGASSALQRAASEQVARGLVGSGAVWLGYELAKHDLMTGAAPTMGSKERQLWLQENRQANSLLIGGQWVNIGRLSPAGNLLALGANLYRAAQQPGANDLATQAINVGAGALKTVADQPFLTGASTALAAIQNPEREGANFVRGLAGSVVPAAVGAVARASDVARVPQAGTGPAAGVAGAVAERIPGLRKQLPPRITTLGARVPSPGWVNALFNPATASPDLRQSDPLIRELSDAGYAVPRPPRNAHETPSDYAARSKLYGVAARQVLEQVLQSPEYAAARDREHDALAQAAELRKDPAFRAIPVAQLADAILAQHRQQDPDAKIRADVLGDAVSAVRRQLKAALQ